MSMNMRNAALAIGLLGLLVATLFLGGCEEDDVAGIFVGANVSATEVETHVLDYEMPFILDVDTSNGSVSVRGVEGIQTVSVTATLTSRGSTLEEAQDRVDRIVYRVERSGGRISLQYRSSEQESDVRRHSGVAFDVVIPTEARVEVDTSNGAVDIERIDGTILVDTSNGAVDVYDATGALVADTSNGRIEVVDFIGDLELDTSNGEIRMEDVAGSIDAETSNGGVTYAGHPGLGAHRIRTSNGSVTVRVPNDAAIAFEASTSSGKIRSSLPLVGDTDGDDWNAQLNPPTDTTFNVRTSNGSIRLEGFGS